MSKIKSLAGDTVLYGASTILGRLLNWLLTPFYIQTLVKEDLGVVVNLYSYISVFLVLLSFGFETGFFRFVKDYKRNSVIYSLLLPVVFWSSLFVFVVFLFSSQLVNTVGQNVITSELFLYTAIIVGLDAIVSIPFADLRFQGKSKKYAGLRFLQVIIIVGFNLFFLALCPYLLKNGYSYIETIFNPQNKLKYVFVSNLISSCTIAILVLPSLFKEKFSFDPQLFLKVAKYSYPIVLVGLFGMVIQNIDKILLPELLGEDGLKMLAVYGANYKIGILMALFIQSFRLAFEPFFFKEGKENATKELYASILKYFTIFGMIIYVGVLSSIDLINILLTDAYSHGNSIIPWVLMGQLMFGIYYSLSLWYKLTDKTIFGSLIGFIGMIIVLTGNIVLVPLIGFIGSAISSFVCFSIMVILSYLLGQKHYPVPYQIGRILLHIILGLVIGYISWSFDTNLNLFLLTAKAFIFVSYIGLIFMLERKEIFKNLKT